MAEEITCETLKELIERTEDELSYAKKSKEDTKKRIAKTFEELLGKDWYLYDDPRKYYNLAVELYDKAMKSWTEYLKELRKEYEVCKVR